MLISARRVATVLALSFYGFSNTMCWLGGYNSILPGSEVKDLVSSLITISGECHDSFGLHPFGVITSVQYPILCEIANASPGIHTTNS
jgi:hypothetical protein